MLILQQILALVGKEIKLLLKDQKALMMLFLMPAFFILVMSFALKGVFEAGSRHQPIEILVINQDGGELATETLNTARTLEGLALTENWRDNTLTLEQMEAIIRAGQARFGLVFEPDYTARLRGEVTGEAPVIRLVVDPVVSTQLQTLVREALGSAVERVRLSERLGDLLSSVEDAELLTLATDTGDRILPEITAPTGYKRELRPTATEQNVPAYAIFGMFFIMMTLARSFLREHTEGVYARLLMAPLNPWVFLLGKLIPYYVINLLQVIVMFGLGHWVFNLRTGDPLAFGLVSLATALTACGLGVLVASLCKSEAQVDTLSLFLAITLAALGGLMVPAYIMPGTLQTLALYTPQAWALKGYQDVIVRGLNARDILPDLYALAGFAGLFMLTGVWRIRRSG